MNNNLNKRLFDATQSIINRLEAFECYTSDYLNSFPKEFSIGILSLSPISDKTLYSFFDVSNTLTNELSKIEDSVAVVASVMIESDKSAENTDIIVVCDALMCVYDDVRTHINIFLQKSHVAIKANPKEHFALYSSASEFILKIRAVKAKTAEIAVSITDLPTV